ncbi:putative cullin binding protein [Botrytis fragariae]|uniref:Putative cullin binding protein n=1 Tax=Botrytis fragariae TaxID=1964551 RepID=A0A8H6B5F6_9HELO|nr:putative cullin binding protein [Botrytis fragariae]KAF5879746.1 putative cullin binding protein [Botrytis fragariae]
MASSSITVNPTSLTVASLLPKLHDADPDYRFMSLNDLFQVLESGKPDFLHHDYNTAAKTVDGVIRTLDDQNGEVQNLAIKCLAPLVAKLPSNIIAPLIERLSTLTTENSVDNSIPAMALRTVVITLPRPISGVTPSKDVLEAYSAISRVLIPRLVGRVVAQKPNKGQNLPNPPPGMLDPSTNTEIDSDAVDVLIEVARCFGPLLQHTEVEALQSLVVGILETEKASSVVKKRLLLQCLYLLLPRNPHLTPVQRRLYITILGSMARSIPSRFGPYLKTLAPFVLSALSEQELQDQIENSAEDGESNPELDDVRESALVALDGFLASCGAEMRIHTEETIAAALRFLKTQSDEDDMADFDDDDDFEADAGLTTMMTTQVGRGSGDLLEDGTLYAQVAPTLIQRFNEREENVRLEVIATMACLIGKTGEGVLVNFSPDESAGLTSPTIEPLPVSGPRTDLARLTPVIVKSIVRLLKTSSIPTKQALINLLDGMVSVQVGGLSEHFGQLVDPIIDSIKTSGGSSSTATTSGGAASATANTLRIAALKLLGDVAQTHSSSFYKISGEAVGTAEQLVKALTPPRSKPAKSTQQEDILKLYQVIVDRVSATDADVEVRQRAIHALGIMLARTASPEGLSLLSETNRSSALTLLSDRLKNETTRLAAVRAIDTIAVGSIEVGPTTKGQLQPPWIRDVSLELAAQLRKANRSLRGASLGALKNLIVSPAARSSLDAPTVQGLIDALLPLLTTVDLHLLGPALLVLATLVMDEAKLVVTDQLNLALCGLLTSSLSGAVLDAVLLLVANIGKQGVGQPLMKSYRNAFGIRRILSRSTLDNFLTELQNPSSDEARQCLALAVLGEAGLQLGAKSPLNPSTFTAHFKSSYDKVPLAAAIALGRAGAGDTPLYLSEILNMIKGGDEFYFYILSRKYFSKLATTPLPSPSTPLLSGKDCLPLRKLRTTKLLAQSALVGYLSDPNASIRAMVIQAIRYTLSDFGEPSIGTDYIECCCAQQADLINPNLNQLLPFVMSESVIKEELIHEVMMGPFKHKVDDGLEVRKSAYETLYALMETAFSRINILDFYDRIIAGLKDEHDIRSLCNLMLNKLVILDPDETARRLDAIADCFRVTLSVKLKESAVKQEIEKQDDATKSTLRSTLNLHARIPSASTGMGAQSSQHQTWRTYFEWVEKDFEAQLKSLREEKKD